MSKNDIVYVSKISGRRARLVNKANGQELGWTSLFTAEGHSLRAAGRRLSMKSAPWCVEV